MERFDLPETEPIEFGMVTKAVEQAQEKVEGANFDLRKHLLEYDDVLNRQRSAVYKRRTEFLGVMEKEDLARAITDAATAHFDAQFAHQFMEDPTAARAEIIKAFKEVSLIKKDAADDTYQSFDLDEFKKIIEERAAAIAGHPLAKNQMLGILDMLWMTNLEDLEALQEAVGLRAYAQHDPLVEYRQEASKFFKMFWGNFNGWIFNNIFKLGDAPAVNAAAAHQARAIPIAITSTNTTGGSNEHIGRNDACPCGSGKKWKKCGLMNTEEHRLNMTKKGVTPPTHEVTGG
jgi:preprotein translocase subunit SecA